MSGRSDAWGRLAQDVARIESGLGAMLQSRHGLGLSEYRALESLARSSGRELRIQELAALLGLNQSSISRMVERLERAGLAIRDVCSDDKRGVYAVLTDKGGQRLDEARPDYETAIEAALARHGCEGLLEPGLIRAA